MNIRKILASVLTVSAVICSIGNGVFAYESRNEGENVSVQNEGSVLRYAQIAKFTPTINSSGSIKVSLTLRSGLDYSMTLELEQYVGGSWEYIDSWYLDGNYAGTISESFSLESGERYRARAYVEVYDEYGDIVESTTKYSSAITAR